jgi:hypothetical protein
MKARVVSIPLSVFYTLAEICYDIVYGNQIGGKDNEEVML